MDSPKEQPKRYRRKKVRRSGPPQRKIGRPSKVDQIDTAQLTSDVAKGVPIPIACAAAGIDPKTFYRWLDEQPDFAQMLAVEKQRVILEALDGIRSCSTKEREFRNWAWFLERVYPDAFAPKPPNFALFEQNNFQLSEERSRELSDRARRLLQDQEMGWPAQ